MPTTDPYSDAYAMPVWTKPQPEPPTPVPHTPKPGIPWPDGRKYRHTDGVECPVGQNQVLIESAGQFVFGPYGKAVSEPREFFVCSLHGEEIVLAPRYRHEEDVDGDCEATEGQVTQYPGEPALCTLHELPVVKVW